MKKHIETKYTCPICGADAEPLFTNLQDFINNISYDGVLCGCINNECQHLFISPMPDKQTIISFYKSYYTHKEESNNGYKFPYILSLSLRALDKIIHLLGIAAERNNLQKMFLEPPLEDHNQFLEIGCGSGSKLVTLRALGWNVTGQEIDEGAKAIHEKKLLNVYYNDLQDIGFESDSFDAIGMNHVIEHIANPNEIFRECFRILKPRGKLIIITPNRNALGGIMFQKYWHGYDFPRHLNIFSKNSLMSCALHEGFEVMKSITSACNAEVTTSLSIESFLYKSHNTRLNKFYLVTFLSKILQTVFFLYHKLFKKSGEELIIILKKDQ